MAFRSFSSGPGGAWVNPGAVFAFRDLAGAFSGLSEEVEAQALASAKEKLVEPALSYGAHPSTHAFVGGDSVYVGVPSEHPDASAVADQEWGTLNQRAGGEIRRALRLHGEESFQHFQENLGQ